MIEDELEKSLKNGCTGIGTIAKKALDELRRLRKVCANKKDAAHPKKINKDLKTCPICFGKGVLEVTDGNTN